MAKKKRREPDSATETLDAIESWGDRIVNIVSENPTPILAGIVGVLVIAGVVGLTRDYSDSGASESASALARVQGDYRIAMGGTPGSVEIPEPANPETARLLRIETITDYEEVAGEYSDTPAAALALLEAGKLQQQLGDSVAAIASFDRGLDQVGPDDPIRAFLLSRQAAVHEADGQYAEAGAAYQQAAAVPGNPLRFDALSDAARTYVQAGDSDQALAAYARIQAEAPDYRMAPYIEARLAELSGSAEPN